MFKNRNALETKNRELQLCKTLEMDKLIFDHYNDVSMTTIEGELSDDCIAKLKLMDVEVEYDPYFKNTFIKLRQANRSFNSANVAYVLHIIFGLLGLVELGFMVAMKL
jgi:hypothetical protein